MGKDTDLEEDILIEIQEKENMMKVANEINQYKILLITQVLWNSKWTFPNTRENIHNHIHIAPKTAKQIWILKKETDLSHMLDIHSKIKDKEWILKGKP